MRSLSRLLGVRTVCTGSFLRFPFAGDRLSGRVCQSSSRLPFRGDLEIAHGCNRSAGRPWTARSGSQSVRWRLFARPIRAGGDHGQVVQSVTNPRCNNTASSAGTSSPRPASVGLCGHMDRPGSPCSGDHGAVIATRRLPAARITHARREIIQRIRYALVHPQHGRHLGQIAAYFIQ